MAEAPPVSNLGTPNPFIKLSKWVWKRQSFIWSAIILNIALGVIVTLLFTQQPWSTTLKGTPIGWAFQNPLICVIVLICVLSFTCFTYLASRLPVSTSYKEQKQRYLQRMIRETEMLALKGIPARLIAET